MTRATIKKPSLKERLPYALTGGVIGGIIGFAVSAASLHLGVVIWMGFGLYCLGVLAGVDDWVSYVSGHCPSCSKLLKLDRNQHQGHCPHCQTKFSVAKQDAGYWIEVRQ